jgi:hypothetical protein
VDAKMFSHRVGQLNILSVFRVLPQTHNHIPMVDN